MQFLTVLFGQSNFMPHGYCYQWVQGLVWLHVISDSLIFLAYMTIPFTLIHIAKRRKDLPFNWIFACFGIFIVACGLTHAMEVWNLWHANYWLAGSLKAVTAAASVLTAILLIQLVPKVLKVPDTAQWMRANATLEKENQERRRLEIEIRLSEAKYRKTAALLDLTHDAILVRNLTNEILFWNKGAEKLYGWAAEEIQGRTTHELLQTVFPEPLDDIQAAILRTGYWQGQLIHRRRDGVLLTISTRWALQREDGKPSAILESNRDITLTKQEEQKFRNLLESAPDAMVIADTQGLIVLLNAETERLFGYRREELIGQPVEILVPERFRGMHPHHRSQYSQHPLTRTMGAGLDLWGLRKDGSEFPVEISLSPIETSEGILISSAIRDVTASKAAAQAMRASDLKFRGILESAPDAMVISDSDGRILLVNAETERVFGYPREELFGQPVELLVPERFRAKHPAHRRGYAAQPLTRSMGAGLDLWGLRKDRSEFPIEISLSPIETPEGLLISSAIRDVTNNKKAERALRISEQKFRGILDSAPDAMVIADAQGRIVLLNAETERLFGYSRDELVGQLVDTLVPDRFRVNHPRHRLEYSQHPLTRTMGAGLDLWGLRKDESEFPVEISLSPLETPEGMLITTAIRDITERKKSQQQLLQAMNELTRCNSELQQFAYVASHDLQEPLRMVTSYTQLLAKRYQGQLDADADEFIGYAVDGCNRMQGLIQDLLAYSRSGAEVKELREISTETSLQTALSSLHTAIQEAGAVVTHDPLPALLADDALLAQLFQNLIGNAIKYHGPEIPRVHISASKNGDRQWTFSVRDNGIGIEPQYFERIFIIFQRLHGREQFKGTGIGLAICKKIVERLGGKIWVESQPEKGSAFFFTLPQGSPR